MQQLTLVTTDYRRRFHFYMRTDGAANAFEVKLPGCVPVVVERQRAFADEWESIDRFFARAVVAVGSVSGAWAEVHCKPGKIPPERPYAIIAGLILAPIGSDERLAQDLLRVGIHHPDPVTRVDHLCRAADALGMGERDAPPPQFIQC